METVQGNPCRVKRRTSGITAGQNWNNRLIGATLLPKIYQRDIPIAFNLLAKIVLRHLIHTSPAGTRPDFCNQLQIASDERRPSVKSHEELIQLIQEQLMKAHNWPFAAALSVVLLVLTTVIIWLYRKLSGVKDLEGIV